MKRLKNKTEKPCGKFSPLSTKCRLAQAFWCFFPAYQRWAESQTQDEQLTPQRTRILDALQERGPQIMSDLKEELGVTATNITALVDALEKDGLVVRKPHPKDRRATLIEITPKATKELSQSCSVFRERVGEVFSVLSEDDRKEMLRILDALTTRLHELEEK